MLPRKRTAAAVEYIGTHRPLGRIQFRPFRYPASEQILSRRPEEHPKPRLDARDIPKPREAPEARHHFRGDSRRAQERGRTAVPEMVEAGRDRESKAVLPKGRGADEAHFRSRAQEQRSQVSRPRYAKGDKIEHLEMARRQCKTDDVYAWILVPRVRLALTT